MRDSPVARAERGGNSAHEIQRSGLLGAAYCIKTMMDVRSAEDNGRHENGCRVGESRTIKHGAPRAHETPAIRFHEKSF